MIVAMLGWGLGLRQWGKGWVGGCWAGRKTSALLGGAPIGENGKGLVCLFFYKLSFIFCCQLTCSASC